MPADINETALRPPTDTRLRIIQLVAEGKTNKEIGAALNLAEDTVKAHLRRMYAAWSVTSRIELVRVAKQQGWIACPNCGPGTVSPELLQATAIALRTHARRLDAIVAQITGTGGERA